MFTMSLSEWVGRFNWIIGTSLVIGAVVDIAVCAGLCLALLKERRASFTRTTRLVDRIILLTIQTGVITSILTVVVTIRALLEPANFVWVAVYMCLTRGRES
ncbi:hypothetical protein HGRIS_010319 [Hohenbuehelia grisea]|uniref:DUF6534 domain-containing protein n=1 Tax=Hohenbuehelia grisea TaxID=104357 RepID=A0ABR3J4K6_9AGAR